MTGVDDAELVAQCLAGETGAFDVLVERHRRQVYQLCYRFAGNHEDASELAQDAFLRAYRALHTFKGNSAFGTWLYRVTVNVCLNRVSRNGCRPNRSSARAPIAAARRRDRHVLRKEKAATVRAAIARPAEEAAGHDDPAHVSRAAARTDRSILGSSVGAVKANFFHALANLKKLPAGNDTMNPGRHLTEQEFVDAARRHAPRRPTRPCRVLPRCAAQVAELRRSPAGPPVRRARAAAVLLESVLRARARRRRRRGHAGPRVLSWPQWLRPAMSRRRGEHDRAGVALSPESGRVARRRRSRHCRERPADETGPETTGWWTSRKTRRGRWCGRWPRTWTTNRWTSKASRPARIGRPPDAGVERGREHRAGAAA